MKSFIKILISLFLVSIFFIGMFLYIQKKSFYDKKKEENQIINNYSNNENKKSIEFSEENEIKDETPNEEAKKIEKKFLKLEVPFTSQTPNGNWDDDIYQNGCEEASVIMAMAWISGKKNLEPEYVTAEIKKISVYEDKIFGTHIDTSVDDTVKFMKEYFLYEKIRIAKNANKKNIIDELKKGNLVITPAYGIFLANPHYTPPGPVEHMLVVIGFDLEKDEFITNDPGTRFGKDYRYKADIFMNAIWAYPTSKKPVEYPGEGKAEKAMIIVEK